MLRERYHFRPVVHLPNRQQNSFGRLQVDPAGHRRFEVFVPLRFGKDGFHRVQHDFRSPYIDRIGIADDSAHRHVLPCGADRDPAPYRHPPRFDRRHADCQGRIQYLVDAQVFDRRRECAGQRTFVHPEHPFGAAYRYERQLRHGDDGPLAQFQLISHQFASDPFDPAVHLAQRMFDPELRRKIVPHFDRQYYFGGITAAQLVAVP